MTALTFEELGIPIPLLAALRRSGVNEPFAIQKATLPDGIAGRDVLARAQTGSGKTLAFGLPLIVRLIGKPAIPRQPQGLVLVPTRELAMQVSDGLTPLAEACGLRIRLIAGGMPYAKQIQALDRGVHILIATPGRLVDLVNRGNVDLAQIAVTVLDEADQMADMGFTEIVQEILDQTRARGQRLLFSATLDGDVDKLVRAYMHNPARHEIASGQAHVSTMEHHVLVVHPMDKDEITARIASRDGKTMLFARTQLGVDRITETLHSRGVAAGALHGGKSQAVRTKTLAQFKDGTINVLVATDVAARGIHVDGISLVVNIDAPRDPKDYVHRAGRTARAGASGTVVTITAPKQQRGVDGLTAKAGVKPTVSRVRPVDDVLVDITGAQQPSGIPWIPPKEASHSRVNRASHQRSGGFKGRSGGPRKPGRTERFERADRPAGAVRFERADRPERTERTSRPDWTPPADRPTKADRYIRPERTERPARQTRPARTEQADRPGRPDRSDRPVRDERYTRPARTEQAERTSRSDRPQRAERSDRAPRSFESEGAPRRSSRVAPSTQRPSGSRPSRVNDADAPRPPRTATSRTERYIDAQGATGKPRATRPGSTDARSSARDGVAGKKPRSKVKAGKPGKPAAKAGKTKAGKAKAGKSKVR